MKWLNYNHLFYFWITAREGGVTRASKELRVSQPTISNQIKELEEVLGHKLFSRIGRGLVLTESGKIAFNYANEMFSMGEEMLNALNQQPGERILSLAVGVADVIPKTLARKLLTPAINLPEQVRLICREDKSDRLLVDLAARRTDVVLSDAPIGTDVQLEGYNHLLIESGVSFFGTKKLAARFADGFPKSLNGAPMLLPSHHTHVRHSINLWLDSRRIHPIVAGEFDDSALMFRFGQDGAGIFPGPTIIENEIRGGLEVTVIGRAPRIRERFYAITREERPQHPAVAAICTTKHHAENRSSR